MKGYDGEGLEVAVGSSIVHVGDRERLLPEVKELRELLPASTALLLGGRGVPGLAREVSHASTWIVEDLPALVRNPRPRARELDS